HVRHRGPGPAQDLPEYAESQHHPPAHGAQEVQRRVQLLGQAAVRRLHRSVGSDFEDPANWANILFDSDQDFFHTRWHNAEFDSLIRKGAGEADPAKRRQLYESAEKILNTDLPAVPLYHLGVIIAVKPWVQGFRLPPAAAAWSGTFGRVKILDH